jgi:hypothetical protein
LLAFVFIENAKCHKLIPPLFTYLSNVKQVRINIHACQQNSSDLKNSGERTLRLLHVASHNCTVKGESTVCVLALRALRRGRDRGREVGGGREPPGPVIALTYLERALSF